MLGSFPCYDALGCRLRHANTLQYLTSFGPYIHGFSLKWFKKMCSSYLYNFDILQHDYVYCLFSVCASYIYIANGIPCDDLAERLNHYFIEKDDHIRDHLVNTPDLTNIVHPVTVVPSSPLFSLSAFKHVTEKAVERAVQSRPSKHCPLWPNSNVAFEELYWHLGTLLNRVSEPVLLKWCFSSWSKDGYFEATSKETGSWSRKL